MLTAIKRAVVPAILIFSILLAVQIQPTGVEGYSNQYLFDEAVEIDFSTDAREGSLDPLNTRDVYKVRNLEGDDNKGDPSQRLIISLKRNSGANVKATFFEPNGRPMASLYSAGSWNDAEFFVPYDGDYFLEIGTDPEESTSTYSIQFGGIQDIVNSENDQVNKPGSLGTSGSIELGRYLNPLYDPVDYYQYDVQPFRAVRVNLTTESTARFEVLNETQDLVGIYDNGEFFEYRNDEGEEVRFHFRIYFPVVGGVEYNPNKNKFFNLNITEWSHTSIPVENPLDPWPGTMVINEDENLTPPLNLTRHFIEEGGDRVFFQVTSRNEHLRIDLVNLTQGSGSNEVVYTYAHIIPDENWHGEEVVSFKASDLDGSVSGSISISVKEVNDLPYIIRIGEADYTGQTFNIYADEDTVKVYKMIYGDDDDPLDSISFSTNVTETSIPFFEIFQNGTMVISPLQQHVGKYIFNVTLADPRGGFHILDIALSIEAVNDVPTEGTIQLMRGNLTLLPSEEIVLEAVDYTDIDGDQLTYSWDWGDGKTSNGKTGSHIYQTSYSGNTTIILTVSDGKASVSTNLSIHVEAPEDIANGTLLIDKEDDLSDAVKIQEEWKLKGSEERVFTVSTVSQSGLDITGLRTQRRGSSLQILLDIKDTIQIDGSFNYHIYIMKKGYLEPATDFKNITSWNEIPLRLPDPTLIITSRSYLGDKSIHENSTGNILNKATLVWDIPFSEMVEGGLTYPIDTTEFDLYAVSILTQEYSESKGLAERFIVTDTAGHGALTVDTIKPLGNSTGSSSSSFGDFTEPSNILVIIGIIVVLLVFGITGFILVRKQVKEKKKQEKEFLDHIESMKKEGKDPFGKDIEDEDGPSKASYKDLYGKPEPKGYERSGSTPVVSTLPGPGLGGPVEGQSHIEELELITGKEPNE
jgi:hypothetical protein